ncbi:hypothetical protein GCM10011495_18550 [Hymenobacter frigidus]|uniref:Uncharacterized protein n=1 Tax=Hymenobacter frigidus TaxID=1524095 RepID=A0ABQ2A4B2_9BACT|nr:hypothetical protein GCM10011495_18550 [Hymenobacter frigidus]
MVVNPCEPAGVPKKSAVSVPSAYTVWARAVGPATSANPKIALASQRLAVKKEGRHEVIIAITAGGEK